MHEVQEDSIGLMAGCCYLARSTCCERDDLRDACIEWIHADCCHLASIVYG